MVGIYELLFLALPLVVILGLGGVAFWVWALVDCVKNEPVAEERKLHWLAVIVLVPFLGGLVYVLARRGRRIARYGH